MSRAVFRRLSILLLILCCFPVWAQQSKGEKMQAKEFGGIYSSLESEQQRLVRNWYDRFNRVTGMNLSAEEGYNNLPQSEKTTFDAVTNALLTTQLTDETGAPLGSTLDLVDYIETVRGRVQGARGDVQFRIYAALNDSAVETLNKSREFQRESNNTIYHRGYPLNYRQQGGAPSMQFSVAQDGKRADIDVDYRSSSFPASLLNGHLTASNSDVRAGNNYDRHINRWSGLTNWWRNLFGLSLESREQSDEEVSPSSVRIAAVPRISSRATVVDAARDFLSSWLLEQKPELAMAYLSERSYACINQVPSDEEIPIDPGIAPYYILKQMHDVNDALGTHTSLAEVIHGIRIVKPELKLKVVPQAQHAQFVMYAVPESLAEKLDCAEHSMMPGEAPRASGREKYGKYFGTLLKLMTPRGAGSVLYFIWAKEGKYWKIVSWNVEPVETEESVVPNLVTPSAPKQPLERSSGNPQVVEAVKRMMEQWFVKQDYRSVAALFTDDAYACINYYRTLNGKEPVPENELHRALQDGLEKIATAVGKKRKLRDATEEVLPVLDTLKLVSHPEESSYALVDVPENIATAFACSERVAEWKSKIQPGETRYGNYYGSIFQLKVPGDPAVLALLWAKRDNQWKVTAFSIETP